ncbi:TetR/AcrR family transcriptional regulator [Kocuria marina]|uniref:TetR/AcrR family transcriptional regulator n=1 Tax=Kocuria marina TaxID=223184 RepID=UPI00272E6A7E
MPRKPVAREKLLTAFEHLVLSEGERAATLDAVAARAGVSKGGLLYHFPHRQALVDAALARCEEMAREDLTRLTQSPRGAAREFLATSSTRTAPWTAASWWPSAWCSPASPAPARRASA